MYLYVDCSSKDIDPEHSMDGSGKWIAESPWIFRAREFQDVIPTLQYGWLLMAGAVLGLSRLFWHALKVP